MPFPCPGCLAAIDASPDSWLIRCPSCGGRLRARPVETSGEAGPPSAPGAVPRRVEAGPPSGPGAVPRRVETRAYDVELIGRPETRRRVEVPWTAADERRLGRWLFWSSFVTLGLAVILYLLARAAR